MTDPFTVSLVIILMIDAYIVRRQLDRIETKLRNMEQENRAAFIQLDRRGD